MTAEMTVLNLQKTYFVIYASFNYSFIIINVLYNEDFIINILTTVKKDFLNNMPHYLCIEEEECIIQMKINKL